MGFELDRRQCLTAGVALASGLMAGSAALAVSAGPRPLARVIVANDFSGDPDGLFALAHHVLCPSLTCPLIIGTQLPAHFSSGHDAADAAARATELLGLMGCGSAHRVIAGAETPITARNAWRPSAASAAIVAEAMRRDTDVPLVYASGAGLTDLALAWLSEPAIGRRVRLIWIGGAPHPGLGNPGKAPAEPEFNFSIDPLAAQVIFNESDIEIWQVPSDTYRQMLFSTAELDDLAAIGSVGAWLKARVDAMYALYAQLPGVTPIIATDAYALGDSPLVTLTALMPPFDPDPSSCRFQIVPTPHLDARGGYIAMPQAHPMRVYTAIDAGLTFRDMTARLRHLAAQHG